MLKQTLNILNTKQAAGLWDLVTNERSHDLSLLTLSVPETEALKSLLGFSEWEQVKQMMIWSSAEKERIWVSWLSIFRSWCL